MFSRIKAFLDRWDLTPILWPTREDGFLDILKTFLAPVVGGIADYQSGKAKQKSEEEARRLMNQYITGDEAAKAEVLNAVGGIEGLMNMASTSAGTSTMTGRDVTRTDMRTMPEWAKRDEAIMGRLRNLLAGRLDEASTRGEGARTARKVAAINRAFGNVLGSDRLRSAVTGARPDESLDAARAMQIADVVASTEDEARARRAEDMAMAQQFGALTRGQHQRGRTVSDMSRAGTTTSTSQDPLRGVEAARMLTAPTAPMVSMETGMTPGWDALSGAAGAGGQMAAAGMFDNLFKKKPTQPVGLPPTAGYWRI
jgi:hypothetical protein